MPTEGERIRVALVADEHGHLRSVFVAEPDVASARHYDERAAAMRNGASENCRHAEMLETLADLSRIAGATQRRYPALRGL